MGDFEIPLSEADKAKLIQLKQFKLFRWFVYKRSLNRGDCFGEAAFKGEKRDRGVQLRNERIITVEKTGVAVLKKSDYFKVLQKVEEKQVINILQFFNNVPFFEKFDWRSLKIFTENSVEEQYSINNFVFKQGAEATNLYVVHGGEFEVLRYSTKKQRLIDPLSNDYFKKANNMEYN